MATCTRARTEWHTASTNNASFPVSFWVVFHTGWKNLNCRYLAYRCIRSVRIGWFVLQLVSQWCTQTRNQRKFVSARQQEVAERMTCSAYLVNDHNKGVQEYKVTVFNPRCTFTARIIIGYLVVILSVCLLPRFLPLHATRQPNTGSLPHWHGWTCLEDPDWLYKAGLKWEYRVNMS